MMHGSQRWLCDNEIIVNDTTYDKIGNIFVNICADDSPVVVMKISIK